MKDLPLIVAYNRIRPEWQDFKLYVGLFYNYWRFHTTIDEITPKGSSCFFYGKSGIFKFIRAPLSMRVVSTHESLIVLPFGPSLFILYLSYLSSYLSKNILYFRVYRRLGHGLNQSEPHLQFAKHAQCTKERPLIKAAFTVYLFYT